MTTFSKYRILFIILLLNPLLYLQQGWASEENSTTPTSLYPKETRVTLSTNLGNIVIELYPTRAPITVANFVSYVNSGHYKGTIFHRVIPGFMAQGGGYTSTLRKKPTRPPILNEADNGLKNKRGTIAMARFNEPHSATSQFFINFKNNTALDHSGKNPSNWGYAVFGKVVKGMDVVDRMAKAPTEGRGRFRANVPRKTIEITAAQAQ